MGEGSKLMQITAAFAASLAYLVGGLISGWLSPMLPKLKSGEEQVTLTSSEGGWLATIPGLSMCIPQLIIAFVFDAVGRKVLLLLATLPVTVGFVWQIFATTFWEMLVSRMFCLFSSGIIMIVVPIFLSEIAEDHIRGMIVTIYQLMLNTGTLIVYCIAPYLSLSTLSGVLVAFPVLFCLTFIWIPESPYYYLIKGKREDCSKSLMRLRGQSDPKSVEAELQMMDKLIDERKKQEKEKGSVRDLFLHPGNRRTLLIAVALSSLVALTGNVVLMSYANDIFARAGASLDANVSAIILAAVQLAASLVAPLVVDRAGRRPLLLASFAGCSLMLIAEGVYFYLLEGAQADVSDIGWLPLTALVIFVTSYTLGCGCLPATLQAELFASNVKGLGNSLAGIVGLLLTMALMKVFQVVGDSVGTYVMLWVFAAFGAVGVVFVFFFIPETKNRPLADIIEEMNIKAGMKTSTKNTEIPATPPKGSTELLI